MTNNPHLDGLEQMLVQEQLSFLLALKAMEMECSRVLKCELKGLWQEVLATCINEARQMDFATQKQLVEEMTVDFHFFAEDDPPIDSTDCAVMQRFRKSLGISRGSDNETTD